ncbi:MULTISPECIES: DUF6177 family protein [Actinomyces]|uniref:Uncharacterized protein n=1 Tax=Actinomyces respiraculi TaxID=2744574 RepID=A0A7T0PWC7_9ACTO|nr:MULTISPECIES: DUF6177 family protein [Actinomyces]QPL05348.1 hypothetical protein ID810_11685 [Actinomyces respiraculi]
MAHPIPYLDDGIGSDTALTFLDEPVVSMDEGLSAYLHAMRARTSPTRLILVLSHGAHLTPAFDRFVDVAGCAVLVKDPYDGYRTLRSGRWAPSIDAFATDGPAPAASTVPPHWQLDTRIPVLGLSVSLFHPARRSTVLGRCAELVVEHLMPPDTTLSWGRYEPAGAPWNPKDMTTLARRGMPSITFMLAAHGPNGTDGTDGSVLSGTLSVSRTSTGLEEYLELVINPRWLTLPQWSSHYMAALSAIGTVLKPQFALAHRTLGYADGCLPAGPRPVPTPLAVLIGAPGIKQLGVDAAAVATQHHGSLTGTGRRHGILVPLETGTEADWNALARLLTTLDGTGGNLARVLGSTEQA